MHLPLKSGRLDFGHQKLVRKWRKGSVQLSEHLAEYKGEARRVRRSGSRGVRGWDTVEVWGGSPRQGERIWVGEQHRRPRSTEPPRGVLEVPAKGQGAEHKLSYSRIYFFSLLAATVREGYRLHRMLTNKQTNPAFLHPGVQAVSETRNNTLSSSTDPKSQEGKYKSISHLQLCMCSFITSSSISSLCKWQ